jgi:hypothetical protein
MGVARSSTKKKPKQIRLGYYTRVCFPDGPNLMDQDNLTLDIMAAMARHYNDLNIKRVKK